VVPRIRPPRRRSALLAALLALGACEATDPPDAVRPAASARAHDEPAPAARAAAAAGETWNAAQIDWQPYGAGLAKAKAQNKPVCLVLFTGWCPHCRNYSHVFDDRRVVERAKDLVMIRANADDEPDVAAKFAPDGGYVPRTFFLAPDGTLQPDIRAARPKFLYFFDEKDPGAILAGMETAVGRVGRRGG
jgi:thiol:disulfide interchange protein